MELLPRRGFYESDGYVSTKRRREVLVNLLRQIPSRVSIFAKQIDELLYGWGGMEGDGLLGYNPRPDMTMDKDDDQRRRKQ